VSEAGQEKERMINEAQRSYNEKIPRAAGEARQTVTQAEGYALERVNKSEGEAKRFLDILAEYQKAPDVTRRRMYLDSFEALLGRIDHLYVVDESQKNILPLFDLNKLNEKGGKTQSPQAQPKGQ
jgi:membrane protease subunit HflK